MTATVETKKDRTFEQELGELYRENYQPLYRAAYSVTRHREDAEDAMHNAFLKLIEGQPPPDFGRNPEAYLFKAAVNEAVSIVRSRKRRRKLMVEDMQGVDIPALDNRFDEDEEEMVERLNVAISRLNPELVALLILRYVLEYSAADIAAMQGRTRAGITMSIVRARYELKNLMLTPGETR